MANITRMLRGKPMRNRILAFAFLMCFVTVYFLLEATVSARAGHIHMRDFADGCYDCAQIEKAEMLLKQVGASFAGVSLALSCLFFMPLIVCFNMPSVLQQTLIGLKIRMNN